MAKKEKKEKVNKKLQKASAAYFDMSVRLGIADEMPLNIKIELLLKEGLKEMEEMMEDMNSIIEEDYDEVNTKLCIPISKQQYKEFVNIMTKIKMEKFTEKNREKYEEQVKQNMFDQCIKEKFLNSVINSYDETIPVPDWNRNFSLDIISNYDDDFNEVLKTSIERNIKVNEIHKETLNKLGLAFEYITKMKYTAKDYKTMLEWRYYNGGVPNETSHAKLFDVFYKFMSAARLGDDFQLKQFEELFTEMGLKVELVEPMPKASHFAWWTKEMIERYCPTIKEDYLEWLNEQKEERRKSKDDE